MFEEDEVMELETSLLNSDDEILESSYIEGDAPSRIDFGYKGIINLVTPKKQNAVIQKLDSPMVIDTNSPQMRKNLPEYVNKTNSYKTDFNSEVSKNIVDVIEISDDSEFSDTDYSNTPYINSDDDLMDVCSPFKQSISNNASYNCSKSIRSPLKEVNSNKQDNVTSLQRFILERKDEENTDFKRYVSDCVEMQSPFKSETERSESCKLPDASNESLLRVYEKILNEKRDCEENLTPNAQGYVDTMLSFLSSLSDKTFGLRCHPGALFFKRHFNRTKASLARHLYYIYNEHVFDKKLPDDMPIKWSKKLTSSCGITTTKVDINPDTNSKRYLAYITLSKKIITTAERLRDTMLHEMCHAAVWLINRSTDSHGPIWKLWAVKARFCLPELPKIKRCHNYETNYKYLYKCQDCGYVIGRSRPSEKLLDKCVCGYCGGKFKEERAKNDSSSFSG
ncbi:uncharacterized protein isoform X2 [Rhodnius prolixus]|uniref:uncharacterized protein isoform X2 n=1 Tax=Rhodnius prolixus TaxID=13249 RepID=UPI003D188A39